MKKIILLFIVFCTYALVYAAEKPNIIIIYTDDQGAGDVSALNPEANSKHQIWIRWSKKE